MAGIYIHIPFCKTRCIYCDFYSTTLSEFKGRYIQTLCRELEIRRDYLQGAPIETIYLGGGTPSQLTQEDFLQIFETIERVYGMKQVREITLEANPDDLTPEYTRMLATLPFNRISMGIQTFNEKTLQLLKRRPASHRSRRALQESRVPKYKYRPHLRTPRRNSRKLEIRSEAGYRLECGTYIGLSSDI